MLSQIRKKRIFWYWTANRLNGLSFKMKLYKRNCATEWNMIFKLMELIARCIENLIKYRKINRVIQYVYLANGAFFYRPSLYVYTNISSALDVTAQKPFEGITHLIWIFLCIQPSSYPILSICSQIGSGDDLIKFC